MYSSAVLQGDINCDTWISQYPYLLSITLLHIAYGRYSALKNINSKMNKSNLLTYSFNILNFDLQLLFREQVFCYNEWVTWYSS